jgi:xylan 1,4-beta-xylosidase
VYILENGPAFCADVLSPVRERVDTGMMIHDLRVLCWIATLAILGATCSGQETGRQPLPESAQSPVRVQVDLNAAEGPYTPIYRWFGYDEANYTTMTHGRELLRELHDLSPEPVYIRVHHLLTSGDGKAELKFSSTNIYSEDSNGKPIYNFSIIDEIFDAYKTAGVRPLVELGFMPKDLAAELPNRHVPYQVHYPQSTVSGMSNNPPKDYQKWEELVRVLTAHLVVRYGKDEVLKWFFEVWNEPDIDYWHASPEDYYKLYDYAVAGVRAALPGARVGGPASTSPGHEKAYLFLKTFLEHVNSGRSAATGGEVPIDFISFHAKGQPTIHDGVVTMGLNRELKDVDQGFTLVASFPKFRHLPVILSEADPEGCAACSSKVNPANNYRNGTLYPAYTAAAYKAMFALRDRHDINLISMLSWSFEFEDKDYFEGFRSLATNGVDKPVINVFRMFGLMNGERVRTESNGAVALDTLLNAGVRESADIEAFATRSKQEAAVLVWNYHDVNQPAPATPATVTITGVPAAVTRVQLEHFRIDETHSNAYTVWQKMGSPQQPTAEQYAELKSAGQLQLLESPAWLNVVNGRVTVSMEMPRQGISLLHLKW